MQLLKHGSTAVPLEPDVLGVIEAAERRGLKQLSSDAAQALGLLLSQVVATGAVAAYKNKNKPKVAHYEGVVCFISHAKYRLLTICSIYFVSFALT